MKQRRRILYGIARNSYRLMEGVLRYAREHNWDLCLDTALTWRIPLRWQGDGIIAQFSQSNPLTEYILSRPEPKVIVERTMPEIPGPRVVHDNTAAGRLAAEHFLERGFEHFAFFFMREMYFNRDQIKGFRERLAENGIKPFICSPPESSETSPDPAAWLATTLPKLPRPLALFAADDVLAVDIVNIAGESGLNVPHDIAVLGTPDIAEIVEHAPVPVSSVTMDEEGLTYRACQMLDRLLDGNEPPAMTTVPPRGVTARASTMTTAFSNPLVRDAISFIDSHYRDPVGVQEIAAALGIDRRRLSTIFKSVTGRTPHAAPANRRLARAQELLRTTDWPLPRIAAAAGFSTHQYLCRAFRRACGCSPTEFRQRSLTNSQT